jgi:hypothetical protein
LVDDEIDDLDIEHIELEVDEVVDDVLYVRNVSI